MERFDGMERLGMKDGRTYWHDPRDGYVYQQKPDGRPNGWICTRGMWGRWGWTLE